MRYYGVHPEYLNPYMISDIIHSRGCYGGGGDAKYTELCLAPVSHQRT